MNIKNEKKREEKKMNNNYYDDKYTIFVFLQFHCHRICHKNS
jgi:hypothetical protein